MEPQEGLPGVQAFKAKQETQGQTSTSSEGETATDTTIVDQQIMEHGLYEWFNGR